MRKYLQAKLKKTSDLVNNQCSKIFENFIKIMYGADYL